MSPARDMGPRLAHWVLPIRGKGSSEFLSFSCALLIVPLTQMLTSSLRHHLVVALVITDDAGLHKHGSRLPPHESERGTVIVAEIYRQNLDNADIIHRAIRWIPLTASMTAAVPSAFIVRGINHLIATGVASPGTATVGSG